MPGAAGTWKDLTGNVNLLAANLTTQVRAIAEVATAVTKGDLTRSIQVDARGEVAELKDNINTMIGNLRAHHRSNTEQDWLKTNLARFTGMLQGQRDLATVGTNVALGAVAAGECASGRDLPDGRDDGEHPSIACRAMPTSSERRIRRDMRFGEGLIGQCAVDKTAHPVKDFRRTTVPIGSGLFEAMPRSLVVFPVSSKSRSRPLSSSRRCMISRPSHLTFLEQLTASIGIVLNSIEATMQTEGC